MDELAVLTRTEDVFREDSAMCFTEIWMHENILHLLVDLNGFTCVRADRDTSRSEKKRVGELHVINLWCSPSHVKLKMSVCTKHIELLAISHIICPESFPSLLLSFFTWPPMSTYTSI